MTATTKASLPACTCNRCPAVRMAKGLVPFCQMPTPPRTPKDWYSSYEAAVKANPGRRIVSGGAGYHNGAPRKFFVV